MFWCDDIAARVDGPQTINDSKTPSGRVHVGSLRGVLIHDAVFRTLREKGTPVRFLFGADDYDALDELPAGRDDFFRKYLGVPLCNVPPPPGSTSPDMADHYMAEFYAVFAELGVVAETYRTRDIYRAGKFDEVIDAILRKADVVREVYKEVSNSQRSPNWLPFHVICENCGRIGTTEVTDYDGKLVTYTCRPDLVKWATGCGHTGKISPFAGNGKLPWKLEWVAKWRTFPVTIEGAGKDHTTRGGSRDVAAQCLRKIFGQEPPLNIPYEFFLVSGAKMSSSRGVGASAREIADLLPPQLLRFLMLRTQPSRPVNFSTDQENIVRLFNEYERYHAKVVVQNKAEQAERQVFNLSQLPGEQAQYCPEFEIVLTLIQMPHLDTLAEIERRKGSRLTAAEKKLLDEWIASAKYWLTNYATDDEKLRVWFDAIPPSAQKLSATQRSFLHRLADALPATGTSNELQTCIFNVARMTPIEQPQAFQAIYAAVLDRASGPKAGNLLSVLPGDFLMRRFRELPYSMDEFYEQSAITLDQFKKYVADNREKITAINALEVSPDYYEIEITLAGRQLLRRVRIPSGHNRKNFFTEVQGPLKP
jgi:lysyl-tRNA synthetase, class I